MSLKTDLDALIKDMKRFPLHEGMYIIADGDFDKLHALVKANSAKARRAKAKKLFKACPDCGGQGEYASDDGDRIETCAQCNGLGKLT